MPKRKLSEGDQTIKNSNDANADDSKGATKSGFWQFELERVEKQQAASCQWWTNWCDKGQISEGNTDHNFIDL